MAGSVNYVIATRRMTLTDEKEYRRKAVLRLMERAIEKKIGSAEDLALVQQGQLPNSVDVRDFHNILDAATALDQWNTAALAVVGTAYSAFQAIAAPTLAANKVAVFYKVGCETIPPPISRVIFRSGGAAGNIIGVFDLEHIWDHDVLEGYFSEPVVIDPTQQFAVQVLCRIATGVLARVKFGALVAEPKGQTIA